jgi:hypothetical protein
MNLFRLKYCVSMCPSRLTIIFYFMIVINLISVFYVVHKI